MSNRLKLEIEQIEIPTELHERSKSGIQAAASEMKRRGNRQKIMKPLGSVAAAAVLFIGVLAAVNPGFASTMQAFFKDITKWNGAVVGTAYNQATEEINITVSDLKVLDNELVLPLKVTFEQADKAPYNLTEALTLGEFTVKSNTKDEVTADLIRVEPVSTKEYSFDIEESHKLMSEIDSTEPTIREFKTNLVMDKELLGSNDTFTLIIHSMYGHRKGDAPLEIKGSWELEFSTN